MLRVSRFLRGYLRHPSAAVDQSEITLQAGGDGVSASYFRPRTRARLPGWIVLHGLTVPGRHHPVLLRFAHALASSGAAVVIPDIPAWRRLQLDPEAAHGAIATAAAHLRDRPDVRPGGLNLVGFSFGATQALVSATRPETREAVRSIVAFGGYCDLRRTFLCMMTGRHEWAGVQRRFRPDPYGRWIAIANHLTDVPAFAHMEELARAALELALEAGRRGAYAAEAVYDPFKLRLRERLPAEQREIWDIIAPPAERTPPEALAAELAERLAEGALACHPGLDPTPHLDRVDQRVVLAHGRDDRLIPFTETLRLRAHLPQDLDASVTITRLFAHSREADPLGPLDYLAEVVRYFRLLNRALRPS